MVQSKKASTTTMTYILSYLRCRSSLMMMPVMRNGNRSQIHTMSSSFAFIGYPSWFEQKCHARHLNPQYDMLASSLSRISHRGLSMDASILNVNLPSRGEENDNLVGDKSRTNFTKYEKLVRRLYKTNLYHPVKLGLENMQRLNEAMGFPLNNLKDVRIIHVTGSNGKGSVCYKVAKSLQNAGLKTGLFVSPHISSFRERMQVNFEAITEDEVVLMLPTIFKLCEQNNIKATFFEVTTALAFYFFASREVDAIVLEVGLGGRLDSTNIITAPSLSIITSIGLEHTRILGDTVEQITTEKAGIIKEGRPILIGPTVPYDIVRDIAVERQAHLHIVLNETNAPDDDSITDFDIENTKIATTALKILRNHDKLEVTDEQIEEGTKQRPPCRFEEGNFTITVSPDSSMKTIPKEVRFILDVAHNPSALKLLIHKLKEKYPVEKKRIVVGFSADKDIQQCAEYLLSAVHSDSNQIHLVQASHPRAATLEAIIDVAPSLRGAHYSLDDRSITTQITKAMELSAMSQDEIVVVCGSVFLMAEARQSLGYKEPKDSDSIAEVAGAHLKHSQENFGDSNPCVPFTWNEHFGDDRQSVK